MPANTPEALALVLVHILLAEALSRRITNEHQKH
jgi:hypothetical protein